MTEELVKEKNRSPDPYRSRTLELEQYHKDGSTIWVEVTASFLHDDAGKVVFDPGGFARNYPKKAS